MPSETELQRQGGVLLWANIVEAVHKLADTMAYNHYKPEKIIAVGRGGMTPAVMLSHLLGDVQVIHLDVSTYSKERRVGEVRLTLPFTPRDLGATHLIATAAILGPLDVRSTLILDDLWDTGTTMDRLGMMAPKALRATLFHKSDSASLPPITFPGIKMPKDQWIVFPWELSNVPDRKLTTSAT